MSEIIIKKKWGRGVFCKILFENKDSNLNIPTFTSMTR
jgi:hypothetical protein